jgi:hydroxycarboxylate dehydrogenase B
MIVFEAKQWQKIASALFMAAGATQSNAARVAESLVDNNLAGHDSHGVIRIIQYLQAIEAGQIDPAGEPVVLHETPSSTMVDGKWTFGQVGAKLAMQKAIENARVQGIAIAALIRAYHIGRLGEYSEMAHDAGMIAMVAVGGLGGGAVRTTGGVAPYGGARAALSTNPISFGFPAGSQPPVMSDFATSTIAAGKVKLARAKGEPLPPNCILDRDGKPSVDPEDYFNGGVLTTFGGHKGYALAVVVDILGQALTGADTCRNPEGKGSGAYMVAGTVFIAINAGLFRPKEEYAAAADAIIQRIKATPPAVGFKEVLLPGEPEQRSKVQRLREGFGLPKKSWETIREQAAKYSLDLTALLG